MMVKSIADESESTGANYMAEITSKRKFASSMDMTARPLGINPVSMTNEEALERIREEFPEFAQGAEKLFQAGDDLTELLEILESFY